MTAQGLIDTTEMYLRTIFELEEEGVVPLRARIAERLNQSGPTVSQTVARMERDGLLTLADDRHLQLTDAGLREATAVMRKHRLAERLLSDVIGLDWEDLHIEACRWEHVMSDEVERRWPPPEETPSGLRPSAGIPMPDFWGGYVLVPETVEFWQAGPFRLHDRLRYRRHDGGWAVERISP